MSDFLPTPVDPQSMAIAPSGATLIVAIGSSAGGLEALRSLFQHLPVSHDFTYVVAQHLAPQHSSMLTDLLSRETLLTVRQLDEDTFMEPGTIYVTAPNHDVIYREGWLRLQTPSVRGPKPSVDTLLVSMAEEQPRRSIGIILSGSGSDGAIGIRRLKSAGGLTIAQDPKMAKYSSMPQSAIATACVDKVLSAEQIGPFLQQYREAGITGPPLLTGRKKSSEVDQILEKISLATNIDFRGYKSNTISRRINQRLVATHCNSLSDYIALLDRNHDEVQTLAQNCLVSVTSFFREDTYFQALSELLQLRANPASIEPVRVWVPGCATGEETYSLSMMLAEIMPNRRIQIFGTDLDEAAITVARRGWYPISQVRTVPQDLLTQHFKESAAGFQVDRTVRDRVVFARHDLVRDPLFLNLDLISCRNLLIYLKPALQEEVMRKFHHALKPGGLLFLGRSEHAQSEYFDVADRKARIYINKPLLDSERRLPVTRDWNGWERGTGKQEAQQGKELDQFRSLLVENFAPPTVLIDEGFRMVESHGDVGRFLRVPAGKPQFTLLALVPKGIMGSLRAQVQRCIRTGNPSRGIPRKLEVEGRQILLQTNVIPVDRGNSERLYMVCFIETAYRNQTSPIVVSPENEDQIRELERELSSTRENLQAVVEELETSNEELQALNEELQSSNEEMQASNEELQSSNEELQSTNEELLTVNEELEHKSIELSFSIEDLENIQNSLDAALFVTDARGYFRHINEDARKLFNLSAENLNGPMAIPNETGLALQIASNIQKIIADSERMEFKASFQGRHFRVCMQPYVGLHKATRGALIVFHEVTEFMQLTEKLRRSEARLLLLASRQEATLNALPAPVAMLDAKGVILVVNNAWRNFAENNGFPDKRYGVGSNYLEICDSSFGAEQDGAKMLAQGLRDVLSGVLPTFSCQYPCHSPKEKRWFQVIISGIRDPKSRGAVVMHHDISEHVRMSERMSLQVAALHSSANSIFITDLEGRIDWVNDAFESMCGYSREEALLRTPSFLEPANCRTPFAESIQNCKTSGLPVRGERDLLRKNGESFTVRQSVTPIVTVSGTISHFIVTLEDTTENKLAQTRMRFLAEHDQLTNLWNRKSFISGLDEAILRQREANGKIAVLFLDLDRFKDTNDTLGHLVGDRMLLEIAQRLKANIQTPDTLARFGGDEFVMFVENVADHESIDFAVNRVLQSFTRPIEVEGRSIFISASVGVTVFPDDGKSAEDLLRNADLAMYRAKAEGRRGYRYYDQQLEAEISERVSIEGELSKAIGKSDLWVAFQPQVDLRTNQIIGAESLLRWKTGSDRQIPIGKVIAIAEESGLILSIGEWVMRESLLQLQSWKKAGHPLKVSVNLSAVQFNQQDVFGIVMQFLRAYDIPPSALKVEITETVLLNRSARVRETLHALHGAGIGLVLDDFGTGYSSLTYLQEFPIESVKIDASFLKGIGSNGNDEAIVRGIIKLAHSLGQRVVAEGVETQHQLDFLRDFECDFAQGFLFAHPLVASEFEQHLLHSRIM
jgi:two-component system CheB/CheR fusion protein